MSEATAKAMREIRFMEGQVSKMSAKLGTSLAENAALTRALAESREALGYYKANGQWEWYMCRFENGEHSLKWHFTTPQAKGSFPSDVADKALTTPPQQERP